MNPRPARVLLTGLLVSLSASGWLLTAGPAAAHADLVSSSPAANEVLTKSPLDVTLTFGEDILSQGSTVVVTGPDGVRADDPSTLQVGGTEASVQLQSTHTQGEFRVDYRIVSGDGHIAQDDFTYTVSASGSGAPATSSAPAGTDTNGNAGVVVWVLGLGAIGVVLVVALVVVFVRGRRDSSRD